MRKLLLLFALCLVGCSPTVTLKDPVTSATVTCTAGPLADINPWSKYQACLEYYVSEGYQRVR